jgi:hypothetical protein
MIVFPLGAMLAMLNQPSESRCSSEFRTPVDMAKIMPTAAQAPARRLGVTPPNSLRACP